jgi:hypothetical protein
VLKSLGYAKPMAALGSIDASDRKGMDKHQSAKRA